MASLAEIDLTESSDRTRWKTVRFGDVAQQVKVTVDPETSGLERYIAGEHMDTDDLHIRSWGTIGDGYLGPAFHRKFEAGQILYGSRRTYLRKIAVADFDGVCANTTFVIEPKGDDIVPELLPFIMQSEGFTEHSIRNSKGSVNPYINWKDLAAYEFALPPKPEQRRIAELLWSAEDAAERYKDAAWTLPTLISATAETHFSAIKGGCTRRVEDIGSWVSGGTPSRATKKYWQGSLPWVSPKDMKSLFIEDSIEHVSEEGAAAGSRIVGQDSILIVVRGMILAHSFPVGITTLPVAFNQDMKALVVGDAYLPKYVLHWLRYRSRLILGLVAESSHGTKRLPMERFFDLELPEPSLNEQQTTVDILDDLDKNIADMQSHETRLRQVKKALMESLLTRTA